MKTSLALAFSTILLCCLTAEATTYYVSPSGSNSNNGRSKSSPWKTISYAQSKLTPGDTLYLRGGTYNEQVEITCTGTASAGITIAAYQGETPVVTNTVPLTGWAACSATDPNINRLAVRNGNWPNIRVTTCRDKSIAPKALFEKQQMLRKASWPSPGNIWPNPEDWMPIPNEGGNYSPPQDDFIVDSANLTQTDDFWNGAQVRVWSHAANNWIIDSTIADFRAAEHKIVFSSPLGYSISSGSLPDAYAIVNSPMVLDEPGEWCCVPVAEGYRIYLWPMDSSDLSTGQIAYLNWALVGQQIPGVIECGRTGCGNYLTIDGLTIRNGRIGFVWNADYSSGDPTHHNLTLRNCVVEQMYVDAAYISYTSNLLIENCVFRDTCGSDHSVTIGSCADPVIRNCEVDNVMGTGIMLAGAKGAKVVGNTIGTTGMHGNGLSAYLGCANVLFARNIVRTPMIGITLEESSNITLYANLVVNQGHGSQIVNWGSLTGYLRVLNNTLIGNTGLYGDTSGHVRYVYNNIMSARNPVSSAGRDYTVFVDNPGYLAPHEILQTNLAAIFADPARGDYGLVRNSTAQGIGCNIASYLPPEFNGFDWDKDLDGNPWWAVRDVGAYRAHAGSKHGTVQLEEQDSLDSLAED